MCGIFGYVGPQHEAGQIVFKGLKRLDYRGYDSWGVAVVHNQTLKLQKQTGKIESESLKMPEAQVAIGHTRWATHGSVTQANAHPHIASDGSFALAQNGIFENFQQHKDRLQKQGYQFISQTDTEVIVRLIEEKRQKLPQLVKAVRQAFLELAGRNTIIVLSRDGDIIACRNGSPLVVGTNADETEIYFSSDTLSFAEQVTKILVLENQQMVIFSNSKLQLMDIPSGKKLAIQWEANSLTDKRVDKEGFLHFMLKEIFENPSVIIRVIDRDLGEYKKVVEAIKKAKNVYTIGSGTAGNSAAQIAYYLRSISGVNAIHLIGAEATEYQHLFTERDVIIAPSQSGETADVLEVLEIAHQKKATIISYVNMPGSYMTRISDIKCMAQAGPEMCVASTKIFVSQIAWGYLVAKAVQGKLAEGVEQLQELSQIMHQYLADPKQHAVFKKLAKKLARKPHIFLLAKAQNLQIIREAMIKIIEESYLHAHAIPAGDLKHYAITIMDAGIPVIFVMSDDEVRADVLNAMSQVKARGAEVIAVSSKPDALFDIYLPVPDTGETSAIMNIVPLQLLAYYLGVTLGHDIDKPRNIAKSVTVK